MRFNIEDYKGKYAMHCKTEEAAKDFCNYLDSLGRKWCNNKNKPKIIRKDIYCLTTNKKFTSFTEAGNYYNINRRYISECCNNKRGYCENNIDGIKYKFMYYIDYIEKQKLQEQN